jgi:hypothetical protein
MEEVASRSARSAIKIVRVSDLIRHTRKSATITSKVIVALTVKVVRGLIILPFRPYE